jgi:2,3-bisphosphoglycerate-independent phosphoglycerate mutase
MSKKPVALIILDGFGYSETSQSNAIQEANNPVWESLWNTYPHTLVKTSGLAVGLPEGQMGNSEVGHMNLGAGRTVYQNFTRVNKAISDGDFFDNEVICAGIDKAVEAGKAVHIFGLASPGGVHSHDDHIIASIELAAKRGAKEVYVHAFMDGRDTAPRSGEATLIRIETKLRELNCGRIASMIGRYYAMDRDNRWDRVQKAYDLITQGTADIIAATPMDALAAAYEQDNDDEFVPSSSIRPDGCAPATVKDGDSVIFVNFRPDRAREITRAFVDADLEMERAVRPAIADFVSMTQYAESIASSVAYPPVELINSLGEVISKAGKKQLRIAETEKYAHVTFFFSGGQEAEYEGEDRILVPSPDVATYDLQPEMSAPELTEKLVGAIESDKYDLIVCNYANGDMVGHTGNMAAAIKAVEALDVALEKTIAAILAAGGECLITADHGNCELMLNPETGEAVTSHTTYPVPLVYVSNDNTDAELSEGALCDLAPTLLKMMDMEAPSDMTGKCLIK